MLKVEEVVKEFPTGKKDFRQKVLDRVTLQLQPNEIFGMLGPSGSGKTTLAKIAASLIKPDAGRVFWNRRDLMSMSTKEVRKLRRHVQLIFQNPVAALDPKQTVMQALLEPLAVYESARSRSWRLERVHALLEECGLHEDILPRHPHEISGGQAQRVVLARSLALNPRVLIADEITSMLDLSVQAQVLEILKRRNRRDGMAIWLISHNVDLIRAFCHRAGILSNGRLVAEGHPMALLEPSWIP